MVLPIMEMAHEPSQDGLNPETSYTFDKFAIMIYGERKDKNSFKPQTQLLLWNTSEFWHGSILAFVEAR